MNRVVYPKEKELIVMAQKKKDSKMMGKIIKTAVSGVLCVALAGGMVAANVLIPPNASSVQSILGLKSGGIDNSKAKTEGINMEYSKPGFDTEAALIEDICCNHAALYQRCNFIRICHFRSLYRSRNWIGCTF